MEKSSLESNCRDFGNKMESTLNDQRKFLISLVNDDKIANEIKDVAIKIIVLFGKVRASGEDLLIAVNLINKHKSGLNLTNELNFRVNMSEGVVAEGDGKESFKIDIESKYFY